RAGPSYTTATLLKLREDHAAARDAVRTEIELTRDFDHELLESTGLFLVRTLAQSKSEYLLRPDLGRKFCDLAAETIRQRCPSNADFQVIVGDGLSSTAVARQVPALLPNLAAEAATRGWAH